MVLGGYLRVRLRVWVVCFAGVCCVGLLVCVVRCLTVVGCLCFCCAGWLMSSWFGSGDYVSGLCLVCVLGFWWVALFAGLLLTVVGCV